MLYAVITYKYNGKPRRRQLEANTALELLQATDRFRMVVDVTACTDVKVQFYRRDEITMEALEAAIIKEEGYEA